MLNLGYFSISLEKITFYSEILTEILNCGFFHSFNLFKKTTVPHNNFFSQTFSVENNKIQRMILELGITYQRVDYSLIRIGILKLSPKGPHENYIS